MCEAVLVFLSWTAWPFAIQQSWEDIRVMAEAQHEIVLLLIEREEFDKVPAAAREIFTLPFPPEEEHRIVKEAEILTSALLSHNRADLAHVVLNDALTNVKSPKNKARLHKEKAFVLRKEGKDDEAMQEFQKCVELEKQTAGSPNQ